MYIYICVAVDVDVEVDVDIDRYYGCLKGVPGQFTYC